MHDIAPLAAEAGPAAGAGVPDNMCTGGSQAAHVQENSNLGRGTGGQMSAERHAYAYLYTPVEMHARMQVQGRNRAGAAPSSSEWI